MRGGGDIFLFLFLFLLCFASSLPSRYARAFPVDTPERSPSARRRGAREGIQARQWRQGTQSKQGGPRGVAPKSGAGAGRYFLILFCAPLFPAPQGASVNKNINRFGRKPGAGPNPNIINCEAHPYSGKFGKSFSKRGKVRNT